MRTDRNPNFDLTVSRLSLRSRPFVLIVEADAVTGLDLADALEHADYEVSGPLRHAGAALSWLEQWTPHCAVLDLPALGDSGAVLAQALRQRAVPFLIYSGHLPEEGSGGLEDRPWITKPAVTGEVVDALDALRANQ